MKRAKKSYSREFRAEAVKMAINSDEAPAKIARRLGISKSLLYTWLKPENQPNGVKEVMGQYKDLIKENKRLKKELAKSKQIEEILKKATAYFAKEAR